MFYMLKQLNMRNQTRKIEEIKDALLNWENSSGNNLINITEL